MYEREIEAVRHAADTLAHALDALARYLILEKDQLSALEDLGLEPSAADIYTTPLSAAGDLVRAAEEVRNVLIAAAITAEMPTRRISTLSGVARPTINRRKRGASDSRRKN